MKEIVKSYEKNPFSPRSPLSIFGNNHWQTIVGSGALTSILSGPRQRPFHVIHERFKTPDGDFFDVEFVPCQNVDRWNGQRTEAIVVILHGLESDTKSPMVTNITTAFLSRGFSCCLLSFRGCSGEDNWTPKGYHLGFTDDLDLLCASIKSRNPNQKIYLCGFSMGGNVILKYLGELGDKAMSSCNIHGAAVASVPFDPI